MREGWKCPRCGVANTSVAQTCGLCRRPKNAPKDWGTLAHDDPNFRLGVPGVWMPCE